MTMPRWYAPCDLPAAAGSLTIVRSRLPAGAASCGCHLSIPTYPHEDREEMMSYVTTCDGGVRLERSVTSPLVNRRGRQPRGEQTSGESPRASWSWRGR